MRYECFRLVLTVTHACELRCRYCYTGRKFARSMSLAAGRAAIERAVRSIRPGGSLTLGFFGGEPLLEADLILALIDFARRACDDAQVRFQPGLTTNGTVLTASAWRVMTLGGLDLCISHDGLPAVHDCHRRTGAAGGAEHVLATMRRVQDAGQDVRAVMVVAPDAAESLPAGVVWLRDRGVRRIDLTLDVWATWDRPAAERLEEAIGGAADVWHAGLPDGSINWFDEKAAQLLGIPVERGVCCGFGDGEIAVAPSGNLYPCERLIGEDGPQNPMRLAGHALEGGDFCRGPAPGRAARECAACAIQSQCNTTCRCCNYVRTGDTTRPDALLCLVDRVCYRETARVLRRLPVACRPLAVH